MHYHHTRIEDNAWLYDTAALVVYNWLINLEGEVNLFWSAPAKGASLLYFAIRYLAFVEPMLAIFTFYPMANKVCSEHDLDTRELTTTLSPTRVYWVTVLVGPTVYIAPAVFSANRAYALSEQARLIYCAVLVLALGPFFTNLVSPNSLIDNLVWTSPVNLPPPALCADQDNTPPSVNLMLSLTIADLIVIVVTWRATYKVLRETRGLLQVSITQVLLFNGALYFIVLLLLNVGHIIMTELSLTNFDETSSYLSLFIDPLMSILATDFLLNLQKATATSSHMHSEQDQPGSLGGVPSLNFAVITQESNHTEVTADTETDAGDFQVSVLPGV
ncbi:hypothetical protein GY45DRAFT_1374370 [Cubamyces sp. BRFM 1775]|nr:hypothetical protein GY45DRAFT_1374370 [Cubamyces sp. BRFM 1775]